MKNKIRKVGMINLCPKILRNSEIMNSMRSRVKIWFKFRTTYFDTMINYQFSQNFNWKYDTLFNVYRLAKFELCYRLPIIKVFK